MKLTMSSVIQKEFQSKCLLMQSLASKSSFNNLLPLSSVSGQILKMLLSSPVCSFSLRKYKSVFSGQHQCFHCSSDGFLFFSSFLPHSDWALLCAEKNRIYIWSLSNQTVRENHWTVYPDWFLVGLDPQLLYDAVVSSDWINGLWIWN